MENKEELKIYLMKEIDLIQEVIKRMAFNSFLIKGWAVTLVSVALLLKGNNYHVLIAFIPLIIFWYLDAFFIHLERVYRKLYEWVLDNRLKTNDFLFDMNANKRFGNNVQSSPRIMFSQSLIVFYGPILLLLIIYIIYLTIGGEI